MSKIFQFGSYLSRLNDKKYFRGAWEPLLMEGFRLLPFQYQRATGDLFTMYHVQGTTSTNITSYFFSATNYITGWTFTGSEVFTSSGSTITNWELYIGEYVTSNNYSLNSGERIYFKFDGTFSGGCSFKIEIKYGGTAKATHTGVTSDYELTYLATDTGPHTIVITAENSSGDITNTVCDLRLSTISIYNKTYVSYLGGILYDMIPDGPCYFKLSLATEYYSQDCLVGTVNDIAMLGTSKDFSITDTYKESAYFSASKGQVITVYFDKGTIFNTSSISIQLYYQGGGTSTFTGSSRNNIYIATCTVTTTGKVKVRIAHTTVSTYTRCDVNNHEIYRAAPNKLKLSISSTVDHAGIYYRGGFVQWWYKNAPLTKAKVPKLTIEGEEREGIIIQEKVISAITYKVPVKVTEHEFNAIMAAVGCTMTITDIYGNSYTVNNLNISQPVWHNGNGTLELSFDDNIQVYTLTNDNL